MALLPSEYDESYFDGKNVATPHPEGYYDYSKNDHRLAEVNRFLAQFNPAVLANKKVLEIGCAKGFLVEAMRNAGIDAYGIDVSQYAIDNAPTAVQPYVSVGNATNLSAYKNKEFDYVVTVRTLEVLDPTVLDGVISEITRISKSQVHIVDEPTYGQTDDYNMKTMAQWAALPFPKNTKIISYQTGEIVST